MFYTLPETCTRRIWYQTACQTRQKLVPVFLAQVLALISGKCVMDIREWLELEPVSLVIKNGRLRRFKHVEHKDDTTLTSN